MSPLVKYPRTFHLPWSEGVQSDDKVIGSLDGLMGEEVVVTEKMDGENTTLYRDAMHARSLDSRHHPSRDWVKQFWSELRYDIPEGWRVCGENVFAKHSVGYTHLPSYFLGFSIWNEDNICLDWDTTQEWFKLLGVTSVPVLYRGPYHEPTIQKLWKQLPPDQHEGYVVRTAKAIPYDRFAHQVGKFVRPHHVQTDEHWMLGPIEKNGLSVPGVKTPKMG